MSERLAEYILETRFDDLPPLVVERMKMLLGYHVALAFRRRSTDAGRRAVSLALQLSAGGGSSTIIGHHHAATMLDAIYAHAELIGGVGNDVHHVAKLPLARASHPVAWIVGEQQRSSGSELLTSLIVAYDVATRLSEPQQERGDYTKVPNKCAFAPFAASAVAVRLLRQDRVQAAHTIAHAAHYGGGEAWAISLIARDSAMAAFLPPYEDPASLAAIEGPKGLYAKYYDGPPAGLEASLARLGREFAVLETTVPRYPMSNSHLAPLEQAQELRAREAVDWRQIADMTVTLPDELRGRFESQEAAKDPEHPNAAEAKRSLRLKLAILFLDGVVVPQPTVEQFHRSDVRALLPKIRLSFDGRVMQSALVVVRTADGRTLRAEGIYTPYLAEDWANLLREEGAGFLTPPRLEKLEHALRHLEVVDDVGEVLQLTVPDRVEPEAEAQPSSVGRRASDR